MPKLPKISGNVLLLGDIMRDTIVRPVADMVRGSDVAAKIAQFEGGSGANQAMWLAKNLTKDKCQVKFIARIGSSDFNYYQNRFLKNNITPILQTDEDFTTGHLVTLVDYKDGERSFFTDRGANLKLDLKEIPSDVLVNVGLLQISAYSLFETLPRRVSLELIKQAKQLNIPFSIDPASSSFIKQLGVENLLNYCSGATLFFANEEEAQTLSNLTDPKSQVKFLGEFFEFIIIKRAKKGALIGTKEHGIIANIGVNKIKILDSTGAGDAFFGGFIAAMFESKTIENCLIAGNKQGAIAATKMGGQP